jgi:VirE N-terminal domain.
METISKEAILNKTHYGLNIYSHILRLHYPDEVVLTLVERDCGLCRNPFNANKDTLHIFIHKENVLGNAMDKEFARHEDSKNAIPAGDAFDFAELHYKQQGAELLQTLNKELNLRIGEERNFYRSAQKESKPEKQSFNAVESPLFSFFKAPISNTKPHKAVSLLQIYNAIKGDYYKEHTERLRAISDVQQARKFKASNFDYCTFSGVFSIRNDKALIQHSNILCIDFDHISGIEKLRFQLLNDDYFETLLLFRSPSGDGLKWIIPIDVTQATHANYFLSVSNYLKAAYNVEADKSGKDISRACFIPHDNDVFINPIYLPQDEQENF